MISDLYHKIMDQHREGIMYIFFGGFTTLISWASYALFVWLGINIDISNILSWVCGVSFAFVTNKWFVFMSHSLAPRTVLREVETFLGSRIVTGVIAIILFPILYSLGLNQSIFGIDGLLAKIVTSVIEIVLNWIFSKYFVFNSKKETAAQ